MTVMCVIQARMASTRLPGKVLLPLGAYGPALGVLLERVRQCRRVQQIVVATTRQPEDAVLYQVVQQQRPAVLEGVTFGYGDPEDVLTRFVSVTSGADVVVRLTADCPLVDPAVIDWCVWHVTGGRYAYYRTGSTFPEGLDVEVFTRDVLLQADAAATLPAEREHVTLWMRRHLAPEQQGIYELPEDFGHIRVTLDYPADYTVLSALLAGPAAELPGGVESLVARYAALPEAFQANASVPRNEWQVAADAELAAAAAAPVQGVAE